jgi:hypothetical protein
MSPTEIPVTELTDSELDAVCGGILNLGNIINQLHLGNVVQINTAVQIGLAIGGGVLSPATVAQFINQSNIL